MRHQLADLPPSIVDFVIQISGKKNFDHNPDDFDLLRETLVATDLLGAVGEREADLTVFAPTDAAFAELAITLGFDGDTNNEEAVFAFLASVTQFESANEAGLLVDVLLYHVSPGAKTLTDLQHAQTIETLADVIITVDFNELIDQDPDVEDPQFVGGLTDVETANGTIQAIDGVLLPLDVDEAVAQPTIADLVTATSGQSGFDYEPGDFDILREALKATGLIDAVADVEANLTVFAPTDGAFAELATTLEFDGHPDNEAAVFDFLAGVTGFASAQEAGLLDDILLYHVAACEQRLAELQKAGSVTTLQGGAVGIDGHELIDNDPNADNPRFINGLTDLEASNGIAHAIDGVLLPAEVQGIDPDGDLLVV